MSHGGNRKYWHRFSANPEIDAFARSLVRASKDKKYRQAVERKRTERKRGTLKPKGRLVKIPPTPNVI